MEQPGEPLDGQLELIATASAPSGTLFPWMGQLQLHESTEADRYEFEFFWRQTKLIVKPDPRCAATYANDYCGHDRSEQNRHRHGHKLNCHFSVLADLEGRPYIFLQLNRDVKKGETLWIDYGVVNRCLLVVLTGLVCRRGSVLGRLGPTGDHSPGSHDTLQLCQS